MSTRPTCCNPRGFTLMETLVAIVLLAIVATGIISLNGQLFMQSEYMRSLQIGTQLQQACMEQVLAQKKNAGYNATFSCTNSGGFTLTVTPTVVTGSPAYCPGTLQCKSVQVGISGNGISPAAATLLFVNY